MAKTDRSARAHRMCAAVLVLVLALLAGCSTAVAWPNAGDSSTGSDGGTSAGDEGTGAGGGDGGDGGGDGGDGGAPQPSVAVRGLASTPVSYSGPCSSAPAAVTFAAKITGTPGTVVAFRWVDDSGRRGPEQTTTLPSATGAEETSAKVKSVWARPAGGWPAPFRGARTIEITSPVTATSTAPARFTITCTPPGVVKVVIEKVSLKRTSAGMCQVEVVVSDRSPAPVDRRTLRAEGSVKVIAPSHDAYGLLFDNGWWPAASARGTYRATFPLADGYPVTFQVSIEHGGVVVAGQGNSVGKSCG